MSDIVTKSVAQEVAEGEVEDFEYGAGPFVIATETTRMPMVFTDAKRPHNPIVYANDAFLKLSRYSKVEVLGQRFNFMLADPDDDAAKSLIDKAFLTNPECDPEVRYRRKNGSAFWAAVSISPVKDAAGKLVQHFASFVDLTRHKQDQERSRLLIDELNHRVKNTLFTVQSIISQAGRSSSDPAAVQKAIESRVLALARSHDLLTKQKWAGVGLADLVHNALEPFCSMQGPEARCFVVGENIRVIPRATLSLSIALHELATNAVKYGAFSNDVGTVHVSWKVVPGPTGKRLVLVWEERDGPPVVKPTHRGLGSEIIERGLVHELEALVWLEYRRRGVLCTIDIPAS